MAGVLFARHVIANEGVFMPKLIYNNEEMPAISGRQGIQKNIGNVLGNI